MSARKTIVLVSSDNNELTVNANIATMSNTIKHIVEKNASEPVVLHNISGTTLKIVVDYCNYHLEHQLSSKDTEQWDTAITKVDQENLLDVIMAAHFLEIKSLSDLFCKAVASLIEGKSVQEIRQTFSIKNDFSPEQEEQVRNEYKWTEGKTK
eukprot:TRINITY_DN2676_c0_g2_i1.p1 TRINITY_DN2676_c0_g2~~TRINITY_DN2676_c0_g2_i1.p1  ORF type:complete len:177 (+),score=37.37 TRINITY_DN2676_c0_g2_i1:75-533(+)